MDAETSDFIRQRIAHDLASGTNTSVVTRFPPEPNGYLHIGHAKSICLNFGVAAEHGGKTYLRFDDTNPVKEDQAFVEAISEDVAWLGFDWGDRLTYASDYFEQLYGFALELIDADKAFVCSLNAEQMREFRGTLTEPGRNSPDRDRSAAENRDLFERMRAGEFADGEYVLRAKIDMASPNINMRDPVLYRIRKVHHQRTGDAWPIYPMYDYTHCICDALEGITHSLCTLEFADHRPLYDWVLDNISANWHPPQIEFSRLGLEHTVMSKRLLLQLVTEQHVDGWDDPRMPTIAGMRRRGVTAAAIRDFCSRIGVTKQDNLVEMGLLDYCVRQDLEASAPRGMAVLEPLKVVITNYTAGPVQLTAPWHQQNESLGTRELPFSGELFIERADFELEPPKKYKRLSPGEMVRLRYGYIIRCDEVITDADGLIQELQCTYFPDSKSGEDTSGLKPKGVIHWVSAQESEAVTVRLYERLFSDASPDKDNFLDALDANSLTEVSARLEPALLTAQASHFQFERTGYFFRDSKLERTFNRTVTLRDSWKP